MASSPLSFNDQKEYRTLGLVLLFAVVLALTYLFLMPPWQHYDEPGHFEYAWLIAGRPGIPERGDYDQSMRREVAASMVEHGFFKEGEGLPNLLSISGPINIGIAQTGDVPLYYWLVSLPLRVFRYTDITFQLYLARFISLGLFLITLIAAAGVARELAPPGHPLRWMLPATLALLPAFVDLMTAVNNDVGAVAFFSLFFWAAVRMLCRGFSWLRLVALVATALLAWYTKRTGGIAVFVTPVVIAFSLLRGRLRPFVWAAVPVGAAALVLLTLTWNDAAGWTRQAAYMPSTRQAGEQFPLGSHAFSLAAIPGQSAPRISQTLRDEQVRSLVGKPVTLGAWIWASEPTTVNFPILTKNDQQITRPVEVGTEPVYYTGSGFVGNRVKRLEITLLPFSETPEKAITVYYDGLILAEGDYTEGEPVFASSRGDLGEWGGSPFKNLLRNPSAEGFWPALRPWLEKLAYRELPTDPYMMITSLLDWQTAAWYFRATTKNLLNTFWAQFGWGHIGLIAINRYHPYNLLAGVTLAGLLGLPLAAYRWRRRIPWDLVFVVAFSLLLSWIPTLLRGVNTMSGSLFIPSSRYAYPSILPTMLALLTGWLAWAGLLEERLRLPAWVKTALFLLFFLLLNLASILSIRMFYA